MRWTPRSGRALDWFLVIGCALLVGMALGIGWSGLRTGRLAWPFVREGLFVLGIGVLAVWTLRNWSSRPSPADTSGAGARDESRRAGVSISRRISAAIRSDDPQAAARMTGIDPDRALLVIGVIYLAGSIGYDLVF